MYIMDTCMHTQAMLKLFIYMHACNMPEHTYTSHMHAHIQWLKRQMLKYNMHECNNNVKNT